jgi:predicted ATP-dependent endonuclease of OLD family
MQKIEIRNFGAIQSADIEIKKILVLIGEQAKGKSTVAKLIYFFKSLKDDLFKQIYNTAETENFDILKELSYPIREKFYDFFGSTQHLLQFTIKYYYSVEQDKYLLLTLNNEKRLLATFSSNMRNREVIANFTNIKRLLNTTSNNIQEQLIQEQNKIRHAQSLVALVDNFFDNKQVDSLYIIAGRNSTVSYSDLFEKYLFASVQHTIEENKKQSFKRKQNTIDESLMLKFMQKVAQIKDTFRKFGGFEGLIETYATNSANREQLYDLKQQIDNILQGKYMIDNFGEKIMFKEKYGHTVLSNSSSGQQESIRILQDIFMNILDNLKVFRIIEEPEAHLFPIAQKQLIELLCLLTNYNTENQIVITTHSPYVLSVFNNLLFATRVIDRNHNLENEVSEIIPMKYRIKADDFAAYSLGNEGENYCKSIVNNTTQLIEQNYLDEVSEILGGNFNNLYALHANTLVRR